MIFATPFEVVHAKKLALAAFAEWKEAQLEPLVRGWVAEGCNEAEVSKRLDEYLNQTREEVARTLRLVTLAALKEGAFHG